MDRQITLRMPGELAERLERAARRMRRSRSDIMRLAVEQYLETEGRGRPVDRVRDLIGRVESGIPDLGERHREYLLQRLRDGR